MRSRRFSGWEWVLLAGLLAAGIDGKAAASEIPASPEVSSRIAAAPGGAPPAVLFEPYLEPIRQQLPSGWTMRLPAQNWLERALDPQQERYFVQVKPLQVSAGLAVSLFSCEERDPACWIGQFSVASRDSATVRRALRQHRAAAMITLAQGVEGFFRTEQSGTEPPRASAIWEQDGRVYRVQLAAAKRQVLLYLARSMATGKAIAARDVPLVSAASGSSAGNTEAAPPSISPVLETHAAPPSSPAFTPEQEPPAVPVPEIDPGTTITGEAIMGEEMAGTQPEPPSPDAELVLAPSRPDGEVLEAAAIVEEPIAADVEEPIAAEPVATEPIAIADGGDKALAPAGDEAETAAAASAPAPADLFRPYLDRIQQNLLDDWVMRLPHQEALLQALDLEPQAYSVGLMSATLPAQLRLTLFDCEDALPSCFVSSFAVEDEATAALHESWPPLRPDAWITLTPEIEAYLQTGPTFSLVRWQQDDLIYTVKFPSEAQQRWLYLARSMANAHPIRSYTAQARQQAVAEAAAVGTSDKVRDLIEVDKIQSHPLKIRLRSSLLSAADSSGSSNSQSNLLAHTLGLFANPEVLPGLTLLVAANGGLLQFADSTVDDLELLSFNLGLRYQLDSNTYGDLGWAQRRLTTRGRFRVAENSLKVGFRRRDRLQYRLHLNSGYELRARFVGASAASDLSRVSNTFRVGIEHDLNEEVKVGADYRAILDIFTDRSRTDLRHQLSAWGIYYITPKITLAGSVSYLVGPVVDLFNNMRDLNTVAFSLTVGVDLP